MSKQSRKQVIYQIAAECFQEKGYTAASMREIAEKVGIEPSSLYSHIKSKEEILVTVCQDCAEQFHQGIDEIIALSESPSVKLKRLIELHIDIALLKPSSITVFTDEWRHLPEDEKKRFVASRKHYEEKVGDILRAGIKNKEFKTSTLETLVNSIISSLRWVHYKHNIEDSKAVEKLKNEMTQFILEGIKK